MTTLGYLAISVVQTLLRMLPFPCRTGLVRIGAPDRDAPVLLTGNFRLTVERVRRALDGVDAYLLVANSHGINVWCAATGGHLTDHDVVSVLKTSGIEELVDHRRVVLPQLAATGVEGRIIHQKTGWRVVWGPVDAGSIPRFLGHGLQKTAEMRTVRFAWPQRLEMAVAWAFPISLLTLLALPFWERGVLPLVGFVWGAALLIFLSFPLYQERLRSVRDNIRGVLLLWGLFMLGMAGCSMLLDALSWALVLRWGLSSLIVLSILGLDLTGSTPTYKSALREDRLLRVELDAARCRAVAFCEQVCPTDVFDVDRERRLASLPRADRCVQCGACIVQCPYDALRFRGPEGDVVAPDTVRRFKLNLLGSRKATARATRTE